MNEVPDDDLDFDEDLIYTYRGELFTGVGYEESDGRRISEIHYVNGRQEGVSRGWHADGSLCEETSYRQNVLHGTRFRYDTEGHVRLEEKYEYGILLSKVERNAQREVTDTFELTPTDPLWKTLIDFRGRFKW
ncbi:MULTISPECIES: toxin-antitoxin system YwqK family antitoxin [unclassified Streptomyces]|uniref:toxin-antitoxin system YwqK family antitoxin n=1 Tax=unclassified Streptomyces TaxID=2593676 RepID=UPI003249070D